VGFRRILLLTALVALASLAAPGLLVSREAGAQQAGSRVTTSTAFTHRPHLNKASQYECVTCHTKETPAKPAGERSFADYSQCARCHAAEKSIVVTQKAVAGTARWPRFYHDKHTAVACAACHEYDRTKDTFTGPREMSLCATCHGAHDTRRPYYGGDGNCGTCHAQAKIPLVAEAARGAFSHRQHLPLERPATKDDCARCHEGALASRDIRDEGLHGAREAACRACHVPAPSTTERPASAPATFAVSIERRERAFTEFAHATHAAKLECATCHALGKDDRHAFVVKGLPRYEGCISCHEKDGWTVRDHGAPIQCARCHEAGGTGQRRETYAKGGLGALTFGEVRHPFLGALDGQDDCARCHYRARDAIASRIEGETFSHRAHATQRCESCHAALATSSSPADSGRVDLAGACAACHKGEAPRATPRPRAEVSSPPFSHASHLAAQSRRPSLAAGCAACHALDAATDVVSTPADVANCRRCHDHKAHADVTGRDLDKCIKCHTGDSLTRATPRTAFERRVVGAVANPRQRHDMGGECARCHAGAPVKVERMGTALVTHKNEPHAGLALDSCGKCHIVPKGF